MQNLLNKFATEKYRWVALVFIALGLAIVIIDNTVLNVAIPYILRDLHTSFDAIQWVISGYALIIATLLITVGRLGDLIGRKKVFLIGTVFFAIGSFIASIAPNITILFLGEALIEAIGAAMMLTSSLALLVSEFSGKERAIAFGIWGSVAGASATIGPLLGGYLTTYYSWRWSLRINVAVAIIAIIGSIFIKESKGKKSSLDFLGIIFSGLGLFSLIFGFIEGRKYGFIKPNEIFIINGWQWPIHTISIIPIAFLIAILSLIAFIFIELRIERQKKVPLLRLSLFANRSFSFSLITLLVVSLGQFGAFFILPIFLQNVLGLNAFDTGIVFLSASISIGIFGPLSGFIASKIGPQWITVIGMFILSLGIYMTANSLTATTTGWTLAPALFIFGMGVGMASAQLTNITLSSVPTQYAGEASAVNATMRQVGTSIGIAVIGAVLAGSLTTNIQQNMKEDAAIPGVIKTSLITNLSKVSIESGQQPRIANPAYPNLSLAIKEDVKDSLVVASKDAFTIAFYTTLLGAVLSLLIPKTVLKEFPEDKKDKEQT